MKAIIAGSDPHELGAALAHLDVDVAYADGTAGHDSLEAVAVGEAELFVVTDAGLATAIPVARELNPDIRVVAYTRDPLPEFVSAQEVLGVDPDLLEPGMVAEELTD